MRQYDELICCNPRYLGLSGSSSDTVHMSRRLDLQLLLREMDILLEKKVFFETKRGKIYQRITWREPMAAAWAAVCPLGKNIAVAACPGVKTLPSVKMFKNRTIILSKRN